MATHSSVLGWGIPGTGEPGGCCLWGRTESDTTEATQQQAVAAVFKTRATLVTYRLKRLPGMQETWVRSLGRDLALKIVNFMYIIPK